MQQLLSIGSSMSFKYPLDLPNKISLIDANFISKRIKLSGSSGHKNCKFVSSSQKTTPFFILFLSNLISELNFINAKWSFIWRKHGRWKFNKS